MLSAVSSATSGVGTRMMILIFCSCTGAVFPVSSWKISQKELQWRSMTSPFSRAQLVIACSLIFDVLVARKERVGNGAVGDEGNGGTDTVGMLAVVGCHCHPP
jgi:hypothetical protein